MRAGLIIVSILLIGSVVSAKKKKKSGGSKKESLFDNKTLNCLVCKALVDEIEALINNRLDNNSELTKGRPMSTTATLRTS